MKCVWIKARFLLAFVCFLSASPSFAVIGTIDDVPAATLLLPYFEVDAVNPAGVNTYFSINNAAARAVLAHVTIWSDQSVPVLNFDVYLTGYDAQTISLRDILINGNLPVTASAGQDPKDTISPRGPLSGDINFTSCSALPYRPGTVSSAFRLHLQNWLQGRPSTAPGLTNQCAGADHNPASGRQGDGILRGYITIDTVNACNLFFPSEWKLYARFLTDQNVLWGDYSYVNLSQNFAQGETLVHIEACTACFAPGSHTFYGRYNGGTAVDDREALPTTVAATSFNGGDFGGGTDFLIWRETNKAGTSYPCANSGPPSWYPLEAAWIVLFDDKEQPVMADECPLGNPDCQQEILIPNGTNRVDLASDLPVPFLFGAVYLNLQHDKITPIYGDTAAQAWLTAVIDDQGRFSFAFDAIQLDNAAAPLCASFPCADRGRPE